MDTLNPLLALAAVFATAAIPHLLVTLSGSNAREHFWFGIGCLAAAGATAACLVGADADMPTVAAARRASIGFSVGWLMAMTWFTVELSGSDARGRAVAATLTVMLGAALVGYLALFSGWAVSSASAVHVVANVLGALAMLALAALVALGASRLWSKQQRFRAVTLGLGLGTAIVSFCWHYAATDIADAAVSVPPPYGFLPLMLLMTYELARATAKLHALLANERIGQAHVSRLAVVGELTASLAHEINQPLGAILSNADAGELMLERRDPALEEVRQILVDIRRDAVRAGNVIRSMRTLVRNQTFEMEKLDANQVVAEVLSLVAADARSRGIPLEYTPSPGAAWIHGDRTRLEQVLLNLVLNAMDATETAVALEGTPGDWRPVVVAVARTDRGEVEIRIADEGTGIALDRLDNLFDSFHTSKAHGMGLGLSIARSLVEAHGGSIAAANNADRGATFRATFPPF